MAVLGDRVFRIVQVVWYRNGLVDMSVSLRLTAHSGWWQGWLDRGE